MTFLLYFYVTKKVSEEKKFQKTEFADTFIKNTYIENLVLFLKEGSLEFSSM